ncbi:Neurotactin [Halotydeus destructor]|nr:Neurotactin [Halotydeus destructor]
MLDIYTIHTDRTSSNMSLLKSAYRPRAQLDGCDDERNLLTHEARTSAASNVNSSRSSDRASTTTATRSLLTGRPGFPCASSTCNLMVSIGSNKWTRRTLLTLVTLFSLGLGSCLVMKVHESGKLDTLLNLSQPVGQRLALSAARKGGEGVLGDKEQDEVVLVDTECGRMSGSVEDGAFAFKGIPYAAPPTGNLRWSRPVPVMDDVRHCDKQSHRKARKFGSPCFQVNPFTKQFEGSEDCLYLNIWTPRLDESANLEVMVWIHGGFFEFGHGHQPGLRPSGKLARKTDTVYVSLNYRLHVLGFLALEQLANSGPNSSFGNYGLWDQIVALNWIQRNIKQFGGNANKVTLFGPDAGAASILAIASNSDYSHLFRSAWLLGPALFFNHSFAESSHKNTHNGFMDRTKCDSAQCLRSLPARRVLELFLGNDDPAFRINDQNDLPIQGIYPEQLIVVDGELVVKPLPFSLELPLLIGTSAQAVEYWPGPDDLRTWTWSQYIKYVTTSLDSFGPRLSQMALEMYRADEKEDEEILLDFSSGSVLEASENSTVKLNGTNSSVNANLMNPELLYTSMVSDVRQTCPVNKLSLNIAQSSNSTQVYRYIVTGVPSKAVHLFDYESVYSFHLWEAIAFFDETSSFVRHPIAQDYDFQDNIQSTVMDFVKDNRDRMWKHYPQEVALISKNITIVDKYAEKRCQFWESEGLTNYVWVT